MPDHASIRESKVNALQASLLAFPTFVRLLTPTSRDNGMCEQRLTFAGWRKRDYSCATARDFHTIPF